MRILTVLVSGGGEKDLGRGGEEDEGRSDASRGVRSESWLSAVHSRDFFPPFSVWRAGSLSADDDVTRRN
jgi:hypothetical protein